MPLTLESRFPPITRSRSRARRSVSTVICGLLRSALELTVERQFGTNSALELAYVGSKGSKSCRRATSIRRLQARSSESQADVQFSDVTFLESRGNSSYNSFQARFQQQVTLGFAALVSYTLAKSWTDVDLFSSFGDSNFPQNSANPELRKGGRTSTCGTARRSDIPSTSGGRGRRFLAGRRLLSALVSGCRRTHRHAAERKAFHCRAAAGNRQQQHGDRESRVRRQQPPEPARSGRTAGSLATGWFDTAAFVMAPYGQFGNSGGTS